MDEIKESKKDGDNEETVNIGVKAFQANSTVLARNTFFNLIGQASVALVAIIFSPFIVRGLGSNSYGLLAIAITVFGSFSLLDLGLGRATTKFVAEYLSKGEFNQLGAVVWTSFWIQVCLGVLGGALLAVFTPFLVNNLLNIPPELLGEAEVTLILLAISAPIVLGSSSLRGALEGSQRFDLVNAIKVSLNISTYTIPLIGVLFKFRVSEIVFLMLITRLVATMAYFYGCLYVLPSLKINIFGSRSVLPNIFKYAGWVAISNIITPFLVQLDRYLIAALVTVGAVTYYSVPFDLLNGLWIIPGAITATLFPVFSGFKLNEANNLQDLFVRPIKYILVSLGPLVLTIIAFSKIILYYWQGPVFVEKSTFVLQILVAGVLINSLSWIPSNLLLGVGRPDLVTKNHMIQLPLYLIGAILLINKWGINGAAIAFTLRVTFEAVLMFIFSWRLFPDIRFILFRVDMLSTLVLIIMYDLFLYVIQLMNNGLLFDISLVIVSLSLFALTVWFLIFDKKDKNLIVSLIPISK